MTTEFSADLRQAIQERGGAPVYVVDSTTNTSYVLMRAEQFEKLQANVEVNEVEAMYPLLVHTESDDWEDITNYGREP